MHSKDHDAHHSLIATTKTYKYESFFSELDHAANLQKIVGTQAAAEYMRGNGWTLEAALHHLAGA